jgi:methyl-accepting chemotaxis protein
MSAEAAAALNEILRIARETVEHLREVNQTLAEARALLRKTAAVIQLLEQENRRLDSKLHGSGMGLQ